MGPLLMFVDTSAVVAILSLEGDAGEWSNRISVAPRKITSALVVLEAAMRLSTMLAVELLVAEVAIEAFLRECEIEIVPIDARDAKLAVQAFQTMEEDADIAPNSTWPIACPMHAQRAAALLCSTLQRQRLLAYRSGLGSLLYFPSSIDRSRAASTASVSRLVSRSSSISTPSAAAVVPLGLVTCLRSTAGSSRLSAASDAAP